ncbi:MAG TPA: hypothetical protein VGM53_26450 [Streptosporangiaceae bacterium]
MASTERFLVDRGLLTRTADCALPSLYGACHEEPYQPGGVGFATWPATKWPWFGQLGERGNLIVAVHRGKNLLVSPGVARLLDPICRAEIARMRAADRGCALLLDHLAVVGPSSLDDLREELRLTRQDLRALRSPLERCGAVVSRSLEVTAGEGHLHTSELARWDQVYPGGWDEADAGDWGADGRGVGGAGGGGESGAGGRAVGGAGGGGESGTADGGAGGDPRAALRDLVVAAVRAAVVAPERELRRWFSWPWYWDDTLVDGLVRDGRLRQVEGHVTTPAG